MSLPKAAALLLVLALGAAPATARDVPSPESVLGFRVGEDRKLADWGQIVDYFKKLDAASDRVSVEEVGRTTEDRPFLVAVISSERNLERLEEIRRGNLRLADPRGLSEDEARKLLAEGKTIVALNHGIHSDEVAATQTSMETAFRLATATEGTWRRVLDDVVVVMLPSHNPDGTQMIAEWYRRTLGTPYEGRDMPWLYQKYTGHDNNRDWYMFTQRESRLTAQFLYDRWHPQIVHDLHQMGAKGPRIFLPPYVDPWEPNVDPALTAAVNALGTHVAARLVAEGKKGVAVSALYDAYSPARAYPHTHGGVRILSECAETRLASPIEVPFEELNTGIGYDAKRRSWNFPDPWPGGTWRVRDIVDYQLSATVALLEHAALNRAYWLRNFLDVNRRAVERREPYAFVLPAEQKDPLAAARLLDALRVGGVEVHRAKGAFQAAGAPQRAGSHVILMAQPASAFAKSLLETQRYPDRRQYPGGPPIRPYDVTAHTLPLLMGVSVVPEPAPFTADLERLEQAAVAPGRVAGRGRWFALGHHTPDLVALGRLLRAGVPVRWATAAFTDQGRPFPAGTLLVPASARRRLEGLAKELGLHATGVGATPPALALRAPRVGLYRSWVPSMDEGWTRFVFEHQVGVEYRTLRDKEVRAGGLRERFDVIVLADQKAAELQDGHPKGHLPDEYLGGLGKEGAQALKAFAEAGGTLVAFNTASEFAVTALGLRVQNVLTGVPETEFYGPGSLVGVQFAEGSPLGHGMVGTVPIWLEGSPAFEAAGGIVVARYPDADPLLSGWLLGGERLKGRAALLEVPVGQGRAVLFGFRPQYRAQTWGTYVPLLNALYTSAAAPAR
jgi:hypothetical protein